MEFAVEPSKETVQLSPWNDIQFLRHELFQLLAVVLASKAIAEQAHTRAEGLEDLLDFSALEERALSRLLVSIAINLRMIDDRVDHLMQRLDAEVGWLFEKIPASSGRQASVRDVCNKIIHADSVEVERVKLAEYCTFIEPQLALYGTERKGRRLSRWHLQVDVINFVQEAMLGLAEVALRGTRAP